MEHQYIEKHDIVGRYLSGRLSDEELMRFEEHFLGCSQCADQLETTDDIRSGLRAAAAEEALRLRVYAKAGWLARVVRLLREHRATALSALILLVVAIAWLAWMWNNTRRGLMQAQQTSSTWQRKYEENAQAAGDLAKEMQTREGKLSAERNQLAAQLENEREARARLADQLNRAAGEPAVVPVFTLRTARDISPNLSDPVDEITISPSSKSIILLLEMEPDPAIQSYRAVVLTADGRKVWSRDGLKPKSNDGLAISFDSGLLKPDTYLLILDGLTVEESHQSLFKRPSRKSIARYTFRVLQ